MSSGSGRDIALAPTVASDPAYAPTDTPAPRDRAVTLAIGTRLGGRYLVRAFLGEGGMGAVYRALDEKLDEEVALKVVRGAFGTSEQLRDEVKLAQKVTHPGVCRTYDLEDVDGFHLIKMEYVAGETLAAKLAREGRFAPQVAAARARAIAAALAAAHAQGIIHRDLKPGNVMIAGERVVLMDFGLAQREGLADVAGTPGYMAPEQLAGGKLDARTDLFALGCVLYEMLAGEPAFARELEPEPRPPPPNLRTRRPAVPRWLARATADLLAADPEVRSRGVTRLVAGPRRTRSVVLALAGVALAAYPAWRVLHPAPWQPTIQDLEQFDEKATGASWSPDGAQLAYVSDRARDGFDLYITDHRGPVARGLDDPTPRWRHDGRAVLVVRAGDLLLWGLDGTAPVDLGPADGADFCGDDIVRTVFSFRGPRLERRAPDGTWHVLVRAPADVILSPPRCDDAGRRILYTMGISFPPACVGDLFVLGPDGKSRPLEGDRRVCSATFTHDGRSVVLARREPSGVHLFEIPSDGGTLHRLTSGEGPDMDPDVSPHDRRVVFTRERWASSLTTSDGGPARTIPIRLGVGDLLMVTPDAHTLILQRTDPDAAEVVETIDGDGQEHVLAPGVWPFPSRDGRRVYFHTIEHPRELCVIPITGGAVTRVARFPGRITLGADGPDGPHVLLDTGHGLEGWRVTAGGGVAAEGVGGLVIPSDSGAHLIQTPNDESFQLAYAPAGVPLGQAVPIATTALVQNFWIDDHRITGGIAGAFYILDVTTGAKVTLPAKGDVWPLAVLAPDGRTWFSEHAAQRATRHVLTNFATRPWN